MMRGQKERWRSVQRRRRRRSRESLRLQRQKQLRRELRQQQLRSERLVGKKRLRRNRMAGSRRSPRRRGESRRKRQSPSRQRGAAHLGGTPRSSGRTSTRRPWNHFTKKQNAEEQTPRLTAERPCSSSVKRDEEKQNKHGPGGGDAGKEKCSDRVANRPGPEAARRLLSETGIAGREETRVAEGAEAQTVLRVMEERRSPEGTRLL